MKMHNSVFIIATCCLLSTACQKITFTPDNLTSKVLSAPTSDAPETDVAARKTGVCSNQESIASCLKCEAPVLPPPPAKLATKAEKLAKIMALSCPLGNRSYPAGYVSPSAADIKSRLAACTEELYPETVMSADQQATMAAALDDKDGAMRSRLFSGLWYQPHYSDDFELYFGLTGQEAAYAFCLGRPVDGLLITSEYAKTASDSYAYEQWLVNPAAQARWNAAQVQRGQLLSCLNKPASAPVKTPPPVVVPGTVCDYKSYEGTFNKAALEEIAADLQQGYKIAMETELTCSLLTSVPSAEAFSGKVKIAAYRCH